MSTSRNVQSIRWGSGTRSESSEARTRLLDAALYCYQRLGVSKTAIADIAAQAKITRPTVYRYFNSHQSILTAVVRREAQKFWETLNGELEHVDNFADYMVEGLIYTLQHAQKSKLHAFLFAPDTLPIMHEVFLGDREYLLDLVNSLRPIYDRLKARGAFKPNIDLMVVCELFNRLAISYLSTPSPNFQSEAHLRQLFKDLITPLLVVPPT
jgi:AcrR family transcriptional regulator